MKSKLIIVMVVLALGAISCVEAEKPEKSVGAKKAIELETLPQKAGYSIGTKIAANLKSQNLDIDLESFLRGFRDTYSGKDIALTEADITATLETFRKHMDEVAKKKAEEMAVAGKKFLEENKKKEGVVELPSGLQYKVITEGTGTTPKATDVVTTNYKGTLIDGTEFDSSYKRGEPAKFPVKRVIPGWTEALQLMKVGAKWELYVPSELAYGPQGRPNIPPNSVLVFELELLDVEAPPEDQAKPRISPQIRSPKGNRDPEKMKPTKPEDHSGHDHK